ncbi:hypothetical protein EDF54_3099 [Rathayibacter sp. PhB93]|uniref:hypothetical protein n=1 Tax=unclassified Rathayibacter TaxID=2609250 RepID=UPI000F49865F|nr:MULTISPECIES: hypothetical protein [unclassified Rathayibacter]ROQ03623.1 hypothetical protein EDF54_3099 [Rathayibacter sp. PhB93]TDQ10648.1 hypothetical protein EDF17_2887 [Rathayibacter sp. PhB1]
MTHDETPATTSADDRAVRRRSLVATGVWTLPVVAMATAAPGAAASPSPAVCPSIAEAYQWGRLDNGNGYQGPSGFEEEDGVVFFRQGLDNEKWFLGRDLDVTLGGYMPVTTGTTYTFAFRASGNKARGVPNLVRGAQYVRFEIEGAVVSPVYSTDTSQVGGVQLSKDFSWGDYSFKWVATTTGAVNVRWHFTVPGKRLTERLADDDIRVTMPVITCS